jgi:FkbM family methyltransferase
MLNRLTRLRKWIGRWRDPRPLTIDEWASRHELTVERDIQRILPYIPHENAVIVDVGANIGLFSEQLLRQRPTMRALLFEPVGEYFERCRKRFDGNANVVVEQIAMGDRNGEAKIWKAGHNYGANSMVEEIMFDRRDVSEVNHKTVINEETIQCRIFADYARENGLEHVDFIKTDTEGYDYAVLRGMLPFIARCAAKPVIFAELLAEHYHPHWQEQVDVIQELYQLGYQEVDLGSIDKIDDVLFLPRGVERLQ